MTTTETLKRTPLYEDHLALGAKMVPFGGWEMPVQYEGIIAEYEQTRQRAALFDISHMGEFMIEGDLRESGLDRIVTMSLQDLPIRSCRYGTILNEHGGTIDDTIVFRIDEKKWFVVVNGATIDKDAKHFQTHLTNRALFRNVSFQIGKVDLQGPLSRDVLSKWVDGDGIEKLNYYSFDYFDLFGQNVLISRTGYTGELGYEIFYPWEKTSDLWNRLLRDDRVKPAGLGARDVLRLEMGYSLYGHELDEHITPLEAGLNKFVDLEKDFIGKEALLKKAQAGFKRKIIGFISENRRSPRAEQKIYSPNEKEIGVVTSGTFSPALQKGIGIGFVAPEYTVKDSPILFGSEKGQSPANISGRNFYKGGSLKS